MISQEMPGQLSLLVERRLQRIEACRNDMRIPPATASDFLRMKPSLKSRADFSEQAVSTCTESSRIRSIRSSLGHMRTWAFRNMSFVFLAVDLSSYYTGIELGLGSRDVGCAFEMRTVWVVSHAPTDHQSPRWATRILASAYCSARWPPARNDCQTLAT